MQEEPIKPKIEKRLVHTINLKNIANYDNMLTIINDEKNENHEYYYNLGNPIKTVTIDELKNYDTYFYAQFLNNHPAVWNFILPKEKKNSNVDAKFFIFKNGCFYINESQKIDIYVTNTRDTDLHVRHIVYDDNLTYDDNLSEDKQLNYYFFLGKSKKSENKDKIMFTNDYNQTSLFEIFENPKHYDYHKNAVDIVFNNIRIDTFLMTIETELENEGGRKTKRNKKTNKKRNKKRNKKTNKKS